LPVPVPVPAKAAEHELDDDADRRPAFRAYRVGVLGMIVLVQISWLSLLVYGATSLFN
jgi:hypothetical protein